MNHYICKRIFLLKDKRKILKRYVIKCFDDENTFLCQGVDVRTLGEGYDNLHLPLLRSLDNWSSRFMLHNHAIRNVDPI